MTLRRAGIRIAAAAAVLAFAQTAALAQAGARTDPAPNLYDDPTPMLDPIFGSASVLGLVEEPAEPAPTMREIAGGGTEFSFGAALGFLWPKHSDTHSLFGEADLRYFMADWFVLKFSGAAYRITFDHNGIVNQQIPILLSAEIFPLPTIEIKPYIIVGAGWYYTKTDYRDGFSALYQNSTASSFGYHGGVGFEWVHNNASIFFEGTYVVVDPHVHGTTSTDFNAPKLLVGLTLRF
jgi:hypothetical protein